MIPSLERSAGRLGPAAVALVVLLSVAGGVVGGVAVADSDGGQSLEGVQASSHTGLDITPDHIDFGTVPPGTRVPVDVTVANRANESIEVGGVKFTGDTEAFEIVSPTSIKRAQEFDRTVEVPPDTSRDITIAFAPNSSGTYEATFTVFGPDGETLVSMTAVGKSANGDIRASPKSLTFEGTTVGSTATRTVTVSNVGNATLPVASVVDDSDAYSVVDGKRLELDPGESRRVTVAFTPDSTKRQTALLELHSPDPDQPVLPITLSNSDTKTSVSTKQRENDRQVNISVQDVDAGQQVTVPVPSSFDENESVAIEQISVTPSRDGNLSLNITDSEVPLSTTPSLDTGDNATGMRYLDVSHSISNENIDEVQYRFRVSKERVANVTADPSPNATTNPDAITMYRYDETGGWVEQNTTRVRTTDTHYVYVTTGDGFSEWTTAAKRPDIRVADASASVDAAVVGETVQINVELTNDGGADGVFVTELFLNGTLVEDRRVTVPDGGTVPVSFERPFENPGTYRVAVNDVSVDTIKVTREGVEQVTQTQSDQSESNGDTESGSDSGIASSLPVVLGAGAVLLVGVLGGLLYIRGGEDTAAETAATDTADEAVIQTEGFGDEGADDTGEGSAGDEEA